MIKLLLSLLLHFKKLIEIGKAWSRSRQYRQNYIEEIISYYRNKIDLKSPIYNPNLRVLLSYLYLYI